MATPPSLKEIEKYLGDQFAAIIARFHENPGMTEKSVQTFVDSFLDYQQDVLYVALNNLFQNYLTLELDWSQLGQFLDTFKVLLTNSVKPLRTIHSRMRYYDSLGTFISPQQVLLGYNMRPRTLRSPPLSTPIFAQFIPIRRVLASLFSLPGLMEEMDAYLANMADNESLRHFVHSPTWLHTLAGRPDDGSKWYPIHIFFDDFQPGNPLGGHAGSNKLGAVYMSLPSLPPRLYSKVKFIFLVMLFKSQERKIFGNSLFKKVIEELNFLSEVGIEVPASPTQTVRVKFALGCLLGDNLGLNQICGFVESFSAKHCCRICSCNYQEAPHREDPATLRDSSNYLVAVAQNDVQATGVKEKAVWLGVRGFDLFINTSPDHMHDFLEGVCPYLMALVLNGLETHLHRFTVSLLNARMRSFDFGPESNIPPALTLSRDKISKMSASEMRVLVLYFGLLIGDMVIPFTDEQLLTFKKGEYRWKVPLVKGRRYEAHAYYRLYLWLRQLHDMLLCDAIDEAFAASLSTHIEALLKCYLELSAPFNRTHLPPKLHFLTHYPTAMLRNGPILSLSSMRFESKHRALKKSLNSVATTVNIPLSASKKIQLQLNSMLLSSKLPSSSFIPGYLRPVDRESLEGIINKFQLDRMVVVKSTKTLTSPLSVEYKIGQILAPEIVDHMPLFFQIQRILYSPILDRAFAEGPLMVSVKFNEHYHAVEVRRTAVFRAYDLNSLLFPLPNTLTAARDGNLYVTMRNFTTLFYY
ncbi:hypothetical protein GE061_002509 [Apolygus lucorum]|uniref:Uncharacterized protein n=1 Tax=Apolygus lucorum TaxID=248454 RepID=A0A6A4JMJ7_APOLU|nr:hypothetical protein GE061_003065 [Apolygus lucorum]KAF6204169.1 hypothetical protein GE061_002509 [Apolygus lucorum]